MLVANALLKPETISNQMSKGQATRIQLLQFLPNNSEAIHITCRAGHLRFAVNLQLLIFCLKILILA